MKGLLVLVALLALVAFMPVGLVSAMRQPERAFTEVGRNKTGTILCILLAGGLGAIYYWARVRPEVREAAEGLGARERGPFNSRWRE